MTMNQLHQLRTGILATHGEDAPLNEAGALALIDECEKLALELKAAETLLGLQEARADEYRTYLEGRGVNALPSTTRIQAGLKLAEAADIACAPADSPFTFNRAEVGVFEFFEALKAYRSAVEAEAAQNKGG